MFVGVLGVWLGSFLFFLFSFRLLAVKDELVEVREEVAAEEKPIN